VILLADVSLYKQVLLDNLEIPNLRFCKVVVTGVYCSMALESRSWVVFCQFSYSTQRFTIELESIQEKGADIEVNALAFSFGSS